MIRNLHQATAFNDFRRRISRVSHTNLHQARILQPFPSAGNMKNHIRLATFATAVTCSSAWTQHDVSSQLKSRLTSITYPLQSVASDKSTRLMATVVPASSSSPSLPTDTQTAAATAPPALVPQGKAIADGHVVSSFRGGLIAVRVDDDIADVLAVASPEIMDPGQVLPKGISSKSSLGGDLMGRQVEFQNGQVGIVVSHRPPIAFVYTDMEDVENVEGTVKVYDSLATVSVDETQHAVDCFGRVMQGGDVLTTSGTAQRPIFAPIPKVSDIALINTPLLTGVTMFDALAPIGKGQNMLMVGHDIQDMRQYVSDILSVQAKSGTKCIYASTADTSKVTEMLLDKGLSDDVMLVSSKKTNIDYDQTSMAAEATVTAATACAIAESLALEKGKDTLVVVDTLDYHKNLWDSTTRVLVDVFGVDAVVKGDRDGSASSEMRAFFSSLIQRSAQYKAKKGGGSVTLVLLCTIPKLAAADEDTIYTPENFSSSPEKVKDRINMLVKRNVPLTAVNLRKIQIPVPSDDEGSRRLALQHIDDLISMSDGQIWLDEELEASGRRPAMDFQRSVTRIGIGADTESRADAPAMRKVVEGLRLDLSQALDVEGGDMGSKASENQARNSKAWLLAMHQPSASSIRKLSESCTLLLAASKGFLGDGVDGGALAGTSTGDELISSLLNHVKSQAGEAMNTIDASLDMSTENKEAIESAIKSFFAS